MINTPIGKFIVISAIAIPVVFVAVFWFALNREGGCTSSIIKQEFSVDKMYKATLLKKDCNIGESITYSIRFDSVGSSVEGGWFIPCFELENDEYPESIPEMRWTDQHRLEVRVRTRTLSGQLTRNINNNLIFSRSYIPKDPSTLPQFLN